MVLLAKGSLVVICITLCILSTVYAQAPSVLSATRVPVLGGGVHIYGRNFGSDASKIKVQIEDPSGTSIDCTDVKIIAPDRVIACQVSTKGTGKSMHVTVTVSTTSSDGDVVSVSNDDNNAAFSRDVPTLDTLTFSIETKTIVLDGNNFGFDTSKVSVTLDGNDYPVLAVDNTAITLRLLKKRREQDYVIPESSYAYVTIDGQSNAANMSAMTPAVVTQETPDSDGATSDVTEGKKNSGGGSDKGKIAGLAVGGAFTLIVVSMFVAAFVMRRNRQAAAAKQGGPSNQYSGKPPPLHVYNSEAGRMALDAAHIGVLHELEVAASKEQSSPIMNAQKSPVVELQDSPVVQEEEEEEKDVVAAKSATEVETTDDAAVVITTPAEHSDDHHSFEEIALHEDIYEKNDPDVSDSSFSESSDDESDSGDASSSLSAGEFSESSPAHTPTGGKRNMLQMSSEFPNGSASPSPSRSPRIQQAPSPPMLISSRTAAHPLPHSSLRRSTIPPTLYLDDDNSSSDGSPLPSPRTISPGSPQKGKKKKASKKGMVRVPSSRLASSGTMSKKTQHDVLDSPEIRAYARV